MGNGLNTAFIAFLAAILIIVPGCGKRDVERGLSVPPTVESDATPTASSMPTLYAPPSASVSEVSEPMSLEIIHGKIEGFLAQLKKIHAIEVQAFGSGSDHIMMMIRSYGDVERKISESDLADIKKSLFEHVGEAFPLKIELVNCCDGTGITGKITEIDSVVRRVLVVSETKKNGNTDDPEANWVNMTDDGIIVEAETDEKLTFENLKVGQEVRFWSTGMFLTSYPGQTSAMKLEIVR